MPDDDTTTNDTTTTTASEAPVALVDADGKFSENFKDSLAEEIRGEKVLDNLGDFNGLMKQFVHSQKQVGMDKVVLPNDKSTENDWNMFYDQIGRPKTAGDYGIKRAEDFPEEHWNDELANNAAELFHKIGLTKAQADAVVKFNNENVLIGAEAQEALKVKEHTEADEAVKALWGAAHPQMMHLANFYVNENTEEGADRDAILKIVGNNPIIADLFAKTAKKYMTEDKAIVGSMITPTPADAIAEAEKLRATPGYIDGKLADTNPARHDEITKKIQGLYDVAYK